jgi:hypothetical protein
MGDVVPMESQSEGAAEEPEQRRRGAGAATPRTRP